MTRHFWVLIHRYAGLYMALFLTVAGLIGSILAFDGEINGWLNPRRVAVQPGPMLDELALRERALALVPQGSINWVSFQRQPGEAFSVSFEPRDDPANAASPTSSPSTPSRSIPMPAPRWNGRRIRKATGRSRGKTSSGSSLPCIIGSRCRAASAPGCSASPR